MIIIIGKIYKALFTELKLACTRKERESKQKANANHIKEQTNKKSDNTVGKCVFRNDLNSEMEFRGQRVL